MVVSYMVISYIFKTQLAQTWQLCWSREHLIAMKQGCIQTSAQIIHREQGSAVGVRPFVLSGLATGIILKVRFLDSHVVISAVSTDFLSER